MPLVRRLVAHRSVNVGDDGESQVGVWVGESWKFRRVQKAQRYSARDLARYHMQM
jgi:hypothetical protein